MGPGRISIFELKLELQKTGELSPSAIARAKRFFRPWTGQRHGGSQAPSERHVCREGQFKKPLSLSGGATNAMSYPMTGVVQVRLSRRRKGKGSGCAISYRHAAPMELGHFQVVYDFGMVGFTILKQ